MLAAKCATFSQPFRIAWYSGLSGKAAHTLLVGDPSFSVKFMLRSLKMTTKARYRVGTGANKEHPLCRLGNGRAFLRSDDEAGLTNSEQNSRSAAASKGAFGPPYPLGTAAVLLACRVNAHRC